ncbi:MAG: nucleotide exchange factor GrpE [Chlorobia bacterium]|nr:nucleotide exchange factor GrpE [Fimbriimonadaceae bacterium]
MTDQETPTPAEPNAETESAAQVDEDLLQLYSQIQLVQDERDQIKDQLLRTMADFQNFRKRVLDEKKQIEERANEKFVVELLPVLDNFERALQVVENGGDPAAFIEGVKAIDRQLRLVLESQRVQRVPSLGQPFDPEVHEALAMVESVEQEDGTVIDEIEAGYKLGDRIIRPARVRVSKKP